MFPVLLQLGPFTIKSYGIFLILGLSFSLWYFVQMIRNKRLKIEFLTNNLLWLLLITILGARIGDIIINFSNYTFLSLLSIWDGNLNFFFGLISFVIALSYFSKKNKVSMWRYLDVFIYPFLITLFFVSIGDLLNGSNYGLPPTADFWPTISFNSPEVRFFVPIHPVQIYTSFYILFCFILSILLRRKKRKDGMFALIIFLIYSIGEFFLEFIRGDPVRLLFDFRVTQLFYLILVILAIIFIIICSHKKHLKIKTIT